MTEVEKDPWLDDEFAQPYSDPHGVALMDDLAEIEREDPAQFPVQLNPETVTNIPAPAAPEPVQVAEPVEPEEPAGPEVIELDGGGTLRSIRRAKSGVRRSTQEPAESRTFTGRTRMSCWLLRSKRRPTPPVRSAT